MISKKDPKKYYKCIGQYCNENYVGDYDEVLFKLLETQKFFMKIGFKITQDIFLKIVKNGFITEPGDYKNIVENFLNVQRALHIVLEMVGVLLLKREKFNHQF